jgi:hypothetical protein
MHYFICAMVLLSIAGCDKPNTAEAGANNKLRNGDVAKVAEAPDGTILWAVKDGTTTIYFASSGTQRSYSCGKSCTRTDHVPTKQE